MKKKKPITRNNSKKQSEKEKKNRSKTYSDTEAFNALEIKKNRKGRPKIVSDQQILNALIASEGRIDKAQEMLGMSSFLYQRIRDTPSIKEKLKEHIARQTEMVAGVMFKEAMKGDIKFCTLYWEKFGKFSVPNFMGINNEVPDSEKQTESEVIVRFKTVSADDEENVCPDGSPTYELDEK